MNIKIVIFSFIASCFLTACVNNIAWKTNEKIKKVEIGMSKDEVINILGKKYMISASSKDLNNYLVEELSYKSDANEEYKLKFVNNELVEWDREHIIKYFDSPQSN